MAEAAQDDFEQDLSADAAAQKAQVDEQIAEQRAHNERVRQAAEEARAGRQPEMDEWKRRVADIERVPPPRLQRPPQAPDTQEMTRPTSLQKTFGMASIFALLSVGITKGASINGLRALGGFMKGAREGNLEQAKMAHQTFLDKMEEVHATNEAALKDYNAIIGNKKFTLEQQAQMYRQKALEYKDEMGMLAQEQGGMNAVARDIKQKADIDFKMRQELDRRRGIVERERHNKAMEGRTAGGAGGPGMNSVLGIPMTDIPEAPPGQKNEAFLKMLPPAQANMVRQMDAGTLPVSGFGGFAVKDRNELLKAAAIYNPNFQASKYGLMTKAQMEATPGGPVGRNELAINTLAEHIDQWAGAMKRLNNSQLQRWNASKNRLTAEFGDPALQEAQVPAGIAAAEMARIVKGGTAAPTIPEEEYWNKVFNTSSSPEQVKRVIWSALEASGGRLVSIERAYRQLGIEKHVLTPEARELLLKHRPKDRPLPEWLKPIGKKSDPSDVSDLEKKAELTSERKREIGEAARAKVDKIMRGKDTDGRPMHVDPASGRWAYD